MRNAFMWTWRFIVAKKKALVAVGIIYVLGMMVVMNGRRLQLTQMSRGIQLGNLMVAMNFWNPSADDAGTAAGEFQETHSFVVVDVHHEDGFVHHKGKLGEEHSGLTHIRQNRNKTVIAIGGGITSKGLSGVDEHNLAEKLQLFTTFFPSFCSTASPGYVYQFYFAYDATDPVFSNGKLVVVFQKAFNSSMGNGCPSDMEASVHLVQCSHAGKPTWAQNDAMLEAYLDDVDYFYRINDDTKLLTKGWVEEFIRTLKNYHPPNIGVVGPNHSGGNTGILTYDFVHKSHVDIFGFYYPKLFTDWWGDDWVTTVYDSKRFAKLKHIRLAHTMKFGKRYTTDHSVSRKLGGQRERDRKILTRYLNRIQNTNTTKPDGRKVIAMSLHQRDPRSIWGAIRNAQLMPIIFPRWNLRFYVPHPDAIPANNATWTTIPWRVIYKLERLGAEVTFVKTGDERIPPKFWSYLVASDPTVEYFLIRDVERRISDRDAAAVNDWMEKEENVTVHCIRDHPKHAHLPIVDGLWGANTQRLRQHLNGANLYDLVQNFSTRHLENVKSPSNSNSSTVEVEFLGYVLWPVLENDVLCHDSVSCDQWQNAISFPTKRESDEYLGQEFDERQESASTDLKSLHPPNPFCDGINLHTPTHNITKSTKSKI